MKFRFILFITASLSLLNIGVHSQTYWGEQVVESTMTRYTPTQLGAWTYQRGFYLWGQYRMWQLTGNDQYFDYIREWLDLHVDASGNINQDIHSLDNSEPSLINLLMYNETDDEKYKLAADYVRDIYRTYPKTSDGGFYHHTMTSMAGELWLDGVYMSTPFLAHYAHTFGDTALFTEVADQIIVYASHLHDTSGLMFHAYDEDGSAFWADAVTHHSPHFWGRSMGWFGMAIVEILEVLPGDHHKRNQLIDILSHLIQGLAKVQDTETGLWYQVPNLGDDSRNWLESSCSSMYSYFTARAIQKGYVDSSYTEMAVDGYKGVLKHKIYFSSNNLINLKDICEGTGVSNLVTYYFNRSKNPNDLHGLGAFLMMCWQMAQMGDLIDLNDEPFVQILTPSDSMTVWPGTDLDIEVQAFDPDGQIVKVEVFVDDQLLSALSEPPWEVTWENIPEGTFEIKAIATDDAGKETTSPGVTVISTTDIMITEAETGTISSGSVDTEHAGYSGDGFVNLANEQGSYLDLSVIIPRSGQWQFRFRYANGSASNRPCTLQWNGNSLVESYDFPTTTEWSNWSYSSRVTLSANIGEHVLRITGTTAESAPNIDYVEWQFLGGNLPPKVMIVSPADSLIHSAGDSLVIKAETSDDDGTVVRVDFYKDELFIDSASEAPWQIVWRNVPAGMHQLKATSFDDEGAQTTSSIVTLFATSDILLIEAETGTPSWGTIETEHAGFSGDGYVNLQNETGTYLDLPVDIPESGEWQFQFQYANASAENRPCEIQWDGDVIVDSVYFPSTTEWTSWTLSQAYSFISDAGEHLMRVIGLTAGSAPNLDYLQLNRIPETAIDHVDLDEKSTEFCLYSNYPNPFNPQTRISYSIPQKGHVLLKMYNVKGACVDVLVDGYQTVGEYHMNWNPARKQLSSGIYILSIQFGGKIQTRKVTFLQ